MNGGVEADDCEGVSEKAEQSCPHVLISLKPCKRELETEEFSNETKDVFESLVKRQSALEFKLSNKRLMHKAQVLGQMRQVPQINEYSRKLVEERFLESEENFFVGDGKKKGRKGKKGKGINKEGKKEGTGEKEEKIEKVGKKNERKRKKKGKFEKVLRNPMSPEIFKHSKSWDMVGEVEGKIKKKKKNVIDRTKDWKEQRDKRLEENKRLKDEFDMLECTFSPQLSPKCEFNSTGSMITKNFSVAKSFSMHSSVQPVRFVTEVLPIPCTYSQISPYNYKVSYDSGYNRKLFIASALPMAIYHLDSSSDSN